ncbi:MAG: ribose ABC transporter [Boseongicola sp.]|nr:ribose ABC transporter [Boseongicola sp.]MDD9977256.1 ribose ABC transporter [Boseongicola sp.]
MLHKISPLLSPDLLHALAEMGHGDDIVIADANFPAASKGQRVVRADGVTATDMLQAVLELFPLDTFIDDPATVMEVVGNPDEVPPVVKAFQDVIDSTADNPAKIVGAERFAFYEKSERAFVIVLTGEARLYGNIILTKGVVT